MQPNSRLQGSKVAMLSGKVPRLSRVPGFHSCRFPGLQGCRFREFHGSRVVDWRGSAPISARFQQGSSEVPAGFVPTRFQQGSSRTLARFSKISVRVRARVPARFQHCSGFPEHAFCWHHSPPQRLKPNRIAVGNIFQLQHPVLR